MQKKTDLDTYSPSNDSLEQTFGDFRARIDEIAGHADQVRNMEFYAKLKNGTVFEFSFDSGSWEAARNRVEKNAQAPASIFNAVVDIIGAASAGALLVMAIISFHAIVRTGLLAAMILASSLFILHFIISAVYHLFPRFHPVREIFARLLSALKTFSVVSVNLTLSLLLSGPRSTPGIFLTILLGAAALFLLAPGTRGGIFLSAVITAVIPILSLLLINSLPSGEMYVTMLASLFAVMLLLSAWSIIPVVLPLAKNSMSHADQLMSNNVFSLVGSLIFYFLLFMIIQ